MIQKLASYLFQPLASPKPFFLNCYKERCLTSFSLSLSAHLIIEILTNSSIVNGKDLTRREVPAAHMGWTESCTHIPKLHALLVPRHGNPHPASPLVGKHILEC